MDVIATGFEDMKAAALTGEKHIIICYLDDHRAILDVLGQMGWNSLFDVVVALRAEPGTFIIGKKPAPYY